MTTSKITDKDLKRLAEKLPETVTELIDTLDTIEQGRYCEIRIEDDLKDDLKALGADVGQGFCNTYQYSWLVVQKRKKV